MEVLRSGISGTASMTKSTEDRSSIFRLGVRRPRAASADSLVNRSFWTPRARNWSAYLVCWLIRLRDRHTGKLETLVDRALRVIDQGHRKTGLLGRNKSNSRALDCQREFEDWARKRTIWPAPITPSDLTSAALCTGEEELKAREATEGPRARVLKEANMMVIAEYRV